MFFPPLDSTVVVDVPPNARAGGVSLLFRARTGSASALEQLKQDGVQVQAWTNAPVDEDGPEGQWRGYNFEEVPVTSETTESDGAVVTPFSLPSPTGDNPVDEPFTLFLTLKLRPLPRYQSEADFLVTYRLLYPSGEVRWLGHHGHDLRCVLKKTDPWLAPPVPVDQSSGSVSRVFSSVTMKEPWGCWAIGEGSVKYYPKGTTTDAEAAFLVFVPKRGPSTFALHQPIILHGAGLKLDLSGTITCRTSTPTRVYNAITSEPELSFAVPDLGLRWLGVKNGYALITSPAHEQPVNIYAVPLLADTSPAERPTQVGLNLASNGLFAEDSRFVVYNSSSNGVLESSSAHIHLTIGASGGSCVVSPVYTLSADEALPTGEAAWDIAYVTPHSLVHDEPGHEEEPALEDNKLDYDSETEFLSQPIKLPPTRPIITAVSVNPRRTVEFLIPLLWRTLGYLVRALILRIFSMFGLPVSSILSHLRPAHPKGEHIETQIRSGTSGGAGAQEAPPPEMEVEYVPSEIGEVVSDSATEVASSVGEKWRPSHVFTVPKGPFSLLAYSEPTLGDDKAEPPTPEVVLDGERLDLKATPLGQGWSVMQAKGEIDGGKVQVYGVSASAQDATVF